MGPKSNPNLDHGWAWVVVFGSSVCVYFMVGTVKSFGLLADAIKEYFDAPTYLVSMVFGVTSFVYTLAAPVGLVLGEQFTPRSLVISAGLLGSLGLCLCSLVLSIQYVIVVFGVLFGLNAGILYGNTLLMVSQYFEKRRSLANGLALAGASIGQFSLPPLIQFLLDTYTLRGTFLILGGLYLHTVAAAALFRPFSSSNKDQSLKSEDEVIHIGLKYDMDVAPPCAEQQKPESNESILVKNSPLNDSVDPIAIWKDQRRAEYENREKNGHLLGLSAVSVKALSGGDSMGSVNKGSSSHLSAKHFASCENIMTASALSIHTKGLEEEIEQHSYEKQKSFTCTARRILDFSVLYNRKCFLYCIFAFLSFFGLFNFILFLPSAALSKGIADYRKALLISICGISDLVGRLGCGAFSDLNLISRYKIMLLASAVLGVNSVVFVWATEYWQMALQSVVYGLAAGAYMVLVAVVLVDFVGLDLLPKSLAVILLLQGLGAAIGQIFLGWMTDLTGDYNVTMLVCGGSSILGAALLLFYPIIERWEEQRTAKLRK